MSATKHQIAAHRSPGVRRRVAALRPRRWDELPTIERNASPSEVALRSVWEIPLMHR